MKRVAIYARMSTDKQNADSPADQIARCHQFAEREGWKVVLVEQDAGISGASRHNRPGLLALFAEIDSWDVLLVWDSSRIARDGEDMGWVRNRLRSQRKRGIEVSTGLDLEKVGSKVMAVLHEEYLEKLCIDTHRGLQGRAEKGLHAGGLPFGYVTERLESGATRLRVDPKAADVVGEIFQLYVNGEGLRGIAHKLNREGVSAPRGKGRGWAPSAIRELLRNPIYRGEYIWNRSEWVKDHETGKRRRHDRPESEWIRYSDESWRIVSDELWNAAQERMNRVSGSIQRRGGGRFVAPRHRRSACKQLLAGFLECGECGGTFRDVTGRGVYECGWRKDRGPTICDSRLQVQRAELERRFLHAMRERVLTPDAIEYVVDRASERVQQALGTGPRGSIETRLAGLEEKIERALDLALEAGEVGAIAGRIRRLEAERKELEAELRALPERPVFDPDQLRAKARTYAVDLNHCMRGAPEETRRALRILLQDRRIQIHTDPDRHFRMEGLFELPLMQNAPAGGGSDWGDLVVAGEGFEPPTSGL